MAYLVVLFLALFSPASSTQSHLVFELSRALGSLHVLPGSWVTYTRMEVVSNALIIAPVSLLGSVVWPQVRWRDWTAFGFLGALLVETSQGVLLPGRQAAFSDVVANASGAMLGAWLYLCLRWLARRRHQGP